MNRFWLLIFSILLFSLSSYAEISFLGRFDFPRIQQPLALLAQGLLGSGCVTVPFLRIFQQNRETQIEITQEAERRENLCRSVLKQEKSQTQLIKERKQRIRELKEKIIEARQTVNTNKDQPAEEEMLEELRELLTKSLKPDLGQEDADECIGCLSTELKPKILEKPASSFYLTPEISQAPVGVASEPNEQTEAEQSSGATDLCHVLKEVEKLQKLKKERLDLKAKNFEAKTSYDNAISELKKAEALHESSAGSPYERKQLEQNLKRLENKARSLLYKWNPHLEKAIGTDIDSIEREQWSLLERNVHLKKQFLALNKTKVSFDVKVDPVGVLLLFYRKLNLDGRKKMTEIERPGHDELRLRMLNNEINPEQFARLSVEQLKTPEEIRSYTEQQRKRERQEERDSRDQGQWIGLCDQSGCDGQVYGMVWQGPRASREQHRAGKCNKCNKTSNNFRH